jgi:ribosomal-protein-alanine N-acetyltransferase
MQVCEIEDSSFSDPYPRTLLMNLISSSPETFLVATVGDKIVGYISAIIEDSSAHILSIAVRREYRKKKVGLNLVTELIRKLKKAYVLSIKLEVRSTNIAAINLYKKIGFQSFEVIKNYYSDGEDAVVMLFKF